MKYGGLIITQASYNVYRACTCRHVWVDRGQRPVYGAETTGNASRLLSSGVEKRDLILLSVTLNGGEPVRSREAAFTAARIRDRMHGRDTTIEHGGLCHRKEKNIRLNLLIGIGRAAARFGAS
jgi:hypothetical protein